MVSRSHAICRFRTVSLIVVVVCHACPCLISSGLSKPAMCVRSTPEKSGDFTSCAHCQHPPHSRGDKTTLSPYQDHCVPGSILWLWASTKHDTGIWQIAGLPSERDGIVSVSPAHAVCFTDSVNIGTSVARHPPERNTDLTRFVRTHSNHVR